MGERDCASFVVSCLNCTVSLINAFIINSPSTLNGAITAPTLTDQSKAVSKPSPNGIQNQGVALPTDMLILSSSSRSSVTSTLVAPEHPAEDFLFTRSGLEYFYCNEGKTCYPTSMLG